jgi:hypothetical protein
LGNPAFGFQLLGNRTVLRFHFPLISSQPTSVKEFPSTSSKLVNIPPQLAGCGG